VAKLIYIVFSGYQPTDATESPKRLYEFNNLKVYGDHSGFVWRLSGRETGIKF
jgi:hypothetical protein